ncbi:sugar hydrolase [Paenibacillus sp. FSL H8-0548]|uniref:alpha-L-rhamnosidase-related protein n=1 Tax=Paenibacillus sp. FSL H8-0548 TaxID=1920422 RepID=UPI002116CA4D|nr:sugar hydrolase [Paenibacillus sp. FSL H8-0548]
MEKIKFVNHEFVNKAEALIPQLHETVIRPAHIVEVQQDEAAFQGWRVDALESAEELPGKIFKQGDSFTLDFGDHQVGYLTLAIQNVASNADAPLRLKLTFGEMPCEIGENFEDYNGWLSRSWLQDEIVTVDILPGEVTLPRRYTFRYVKIEVLSTSIRYHVSFPDVYCTAISSGDAAVVQALPAHMPEHLKEMDRIAIKTLQNCMHTVFEDGPKRDRRLWIGDLRLQALANYETFRSDDLVKRCLYLFAGMPLEDGQVGGCLYEKPAPFVDDIYLYDYALFFAATLYDYYEATGDKETLQELWPVAKLQIEIGLKRLDERGIVKDDETWYCFLDWHEQLNKQGGAQAVLIYSMRRGLKLALAVMDTEAAEKIASQLERVIDAAKMYLWDEASQFFVSGEQRQVSWATQIWMVLAEVFGQEENAKLLERLAAYPAAIEMSTPYLYHHYIEALILSNRKDEALIQMNAYWGEMMKDGADTFWELYNPKDKKLSPYGSNLVNSYCHAWSCTPTYFIRKYYLS